MLPYVAEAGFLLYGNSRCWVRVLHPTEELWNKHRLTVENRYFYDGGIHTNYCTFGRHTIIWLTGLSKQWLGPAQCNTPILHIWSKNSHNMHYCSIITLTFANTFSNTTSAAHLRLSNLFQTWTRSWQRVMESALLACKVNIQQCLPHPYCNITG